MYCKSCGEKIENPNAAICVKCGVEKGQGNTFCPTCGAASQNPNAEICLSCGVPMKTNMKGNVSSEVLAKKFCPYCGAEVNSNAEICLTCGVNVKASNKQGMRKFCMDCAAPVNNPNAEICLGCGVRFSHSNRILGSTDAILNKAYTNQDGEVSMFGHFVNALKNYANAKGRASRKEYWSFFMFLSIFVWGTYLAAAVAYSLWLWSLSGILLIVFLVLMFGLTVPFVCMTIRRMHDAGRNGWFCLIPFANIVFAVEKSEPGDNQYGPNPYGIDG